MATPKGAITGAVPTININSQAKASPSNQAIGNTDTVQFRNNDQANNAAVTFQGAGAGVFSLNGNPVTTVTVLPNGGVTGPLTPGQSNLSVDYVVNLGSISGGVFSIEIGSGPLEIDILDTSGNTNLVNAAIPNNGSLFFKNETQDSALITFGGDPNVLFDSNGNPVTSQTVNANSSGAPLTGRGTNKNVTYTTKMTPGERMRVRDGGGTIKVGS